MQVTHSRAGGNKKLKDTQTTHEPNPAKVLLCNFELMIATNLLQVEMSSLHTLKLKDRSAGVSYERNWSICVPLSRMREIV